MIKFCQKTIDFLKKKKKKRKKNPKLEKSDEQLEKLDEYDVYYSSVSVSRDFFSLDIELRKDNDNGIEQNEIEQRGTEEETN